MVSRCSTRYRKFHRAAETGEANYKGYAGLTKRLARLMVVASVLVVAACAETRFVVHSAKRVMGPSEEPPKADYKIGKPYQIKGAWYYPREDFEYDETGIASWYGTKFHGRRTANGELYDMNALTAAHRTLPMPSYVRVTNLENGRSLIVRVNDRGPFARGRIIDMSRRGSQLLGFQKQGTARVRVQILADRSRAMKARLKNRAELAKVGSPITVDRLPKPRVQSQSLPPPAPASPVPPAPASAAPAETQSQSVIATPEPVAQEEAFEPSGVVEQRPVGSTQIYIQAGAFGRYDNANKVRAKLSPLGPVKLSQVLVNGRDLYRVRLGPLASVAAAYRMLGAVADAGYPEARIIVE